MRTRVYVSLLVAPLAFLASCVVTPTPLPDPPGTDVDVARMTLVASAPMKLTLAGEPGAFDPGGFTLRVTNPAAEPPIELPNSGRIETQVDAGGAFSADVAGALSDSLYLESTGPDGDVFLARVTSDGGTGVSILDPGPDTDTDGSPDAIDCAPQDSEVRGSECGGVCTVEAECDPPFSCISGVCSTP